MTYINQNKLKEIIDQRPDDVSPEDIVTELSNRGHEIEGFDPSEILQQDSSIEDANSYDDGYVKYSKEDSLNEPIGDVAELKQPIDNVNIIAGEEQGQPQQEIQRSELEYEGEDIPIDVKPPSLMNPQERIDSGQELRRPEEDFAPLELISNAPESFVDYAKNIGEMISNPKQTAEGVVKLGVSGAVKLMNKIGMLNPSNKAIAEVLVNSIKLDVNTLSPKLDIQEGIEQTGEKSIADHFVDKLSDRWGSPLEIKKSFEKDPAGMLAELSAVVMGFGNLAKAGGATQFGRAVANVGRSIEPLNIVVKSGGKTIQAISAANKSLKINKILDTTLESMADRMSDSYLKINKNTALKVLKDEIGGVTPERWLTKNNIFGSMDKIVEQLDIVKSKSMGVIDSKLNSTKGFFKNKYINGSVKKLKKAFNKLEVESPESQIQKQIFDNISKRSKNEGLNLKEINYLKKQMNKQKIFDNKGDVRSGLNELEIKDLNNLRKGLRRTIEAESSKQNITGIKKLNQDYAVADNISTALKESLAIKNKGAILDVADRLILTSGGVGGIASGNLFTSLAASVGLVTVRKVLASQTFKTAIARKLQSLSSNQFKQLESLRDFNNVKNTSMWNTVKKLSLEAVKETIAEQRAGTRTGVSLANNKEDD